MAEKAVVFMKVDVLVEVDKSEDYYLMVEQAEQLLKKHVREGIGFFPFRSVVDMVDEGSTVKEVVNRLTIQPGTGLGDR
jgi:hypothetical protein